jgi:hypothetical protein
LEPDTCRKRCHRQLRQLLRDQQHQLVELRGAQRGPRQSGVFDHLLRGLLGGEVAEHGAINAAHHGDAVGADDRDVNQVRRTGLRCRTHQAPGFVLVALGAAGGASEVHDGLDPLHRGLNALSGGQVTAQIPYAILCLTAAPAEYSHVRTSIPQAPDDVSSEPTGAAGNQDGWCHCSS